ncbi:tRNA (adenosine(37)-N6)-threonylcarbamoyltransferase complex dimerization subunit type 1 TsaB [Jannaschia sp. CCS1]|uniref:tRNA (adenosine(37)-N6)-threonylcarbamoyltransferase complex dimerization subunit type 1 TsaB n=1 Tax=Jannaschia sp. (strain CCS1) TaxID=290400 RepID=UPI000053ABE3|nr:tRNA (adenosine(37)-N6)-threonylcarbamoyltransferase complex dimerization subunit type 1 TsaB [Jannaschia sp. CCS1]ABD53780.1 peptidase M22 glycoprotease [Jannaschia sp. CCS1]
MAHPTILAFDTSGPWVGTALLRDGDVRAAHYIDMKRGQAEHLMPLVEQTLAEAGTALHDLDAIGVGIGPGNFTGIRISVSAARGLALALEVPAIGVSVLDSLAYKAPRPCLATRNAPRDTLYVQRFGDGLDRAPAHVLKANLADWITPNITLVGQDSPEMSRAHGIDHAPAAYAPASAIARITAMRLGTPQPRPAPLYIKPADAAPARETGPQML